MPEYDEALGSLPERDRAAVTSFLLMLQGSKDSGSLIDRMDPEHVTLQLQNERLAEEHAFQKSKLNFRENVMQIVVILVALLCLAALLLVALIYYKDKPEFVEKIIFSVGGAVAGAIGGYGFGRAKRNG